MSINLQVIITVTKTDGTGQPVGEPVYSSKSLITGDNDSPNLKVTIPGHASKWWVRVGAGTRDWLKFFALSPAPDSNLTFYATDRNKSETIETALSQPIAYWGNALDQLFKGADGGTDLMELENLYFSNSDGCPVEVTIYYVCKATKTPPADPCPKKAAS
jgi:hypothetical protein